MTEQSAKRWTSTAGPIQTKRAAAALNTLRDRAFETVELNGIIGGDEYAMVSRHFGSILGETFQNGGKPTEAILTVASIYDEVGFQFGWTITAENYRAVIAAASEADERAKALRPVKDSRRTPEQDAQEKAERAAKYAIETTARDEAMQPVRAIIEKAKAAGAAAVIIAEADVDASDSQTDYFASHASATYAIGYRYGSREDFKQLRAAAERFLTQRGDTESLAKLTEHRDNYSMGSGNYLSDHGWDGSGSGWTIRSRSLEWRDPLPAGTVDAIPADTAKASQTVGDVTVRPSAIRPDYVEVVFPSKPDADTLAELRGAGFRWALRSRCWYGPSARLPQSYQTA